MNQENYRHTYRTGRTNPPKSHQGLIATLLILVTVLSSIVTVLGMMNIQLWNKIQAQDQPELAFSMNDWAAFSEEEDSLAFPLEEDTILGMTCQEISGLYRNYNQWPYGLYISYVEPGSPAALAQICAGDILVSVNGDPITFPEELAQLVETLPPGKQLELTLYREEEKIKVFLD